MNVRYECVYVCILWACNHREKDTETRRAREICHCAGTWDVFAFWGNLMRLLCGDADHHEERMRCDCQRERYFFKWDILVCEGMYFLALLFHVVNKKVREKVGKSIFRSPALPLSRFPSIYNPGLLLKFYCCRFIYYRAAVTDWEQCHYIHISHHSLLSLLSSAICLVVFHIIWPYFLEVLY